MVNKLYIDENGINSIHTVDHIIYRSQQKVKQIDLNSMNILACRHDALQKYQPISVQQAMRKDNVGTLLTSIRGNRSTNPSVLIFSLH